MESTGTLSSIRKKARKALTPARRIIPSARGILLGNKITAYWYAGETNFGDLLTPLILDYYGFTPVHHDIDGAEVLSVGSILQDAPEDFVGHIIGSGLIDDFTREFPQARVWAVRGELTRERISARTDVPLGDPGLLAARFLKKRQSRSYRLGVVPHYMDKRDPKLVELKKKYKEDVLMIDVQRRPLAVFEDIDRCEYILSSSLHGLVVADSLCIPNRWLSLSAKVRGKGFKFRDYFSSFGVSHDAYHLSGGETLLELQRYCHPPPESIPEIAHELDCASRSLKDHFTGK
jgi:pyruvyltransferase